MITHLKNRYQSSQFLKNVLTLMIGSVFSQAIPILISPLLTRLYKPDDFGLFALYTSIAQLIGVIATARYELAIMIPEKDEDALNLLVLSVSITAMVTVGSMLVMWIFNSAICRLAGNDQLSTWLYFVPLSVFFLGIFQALNYWFNRKKKYHFIRCKESTLQD